MNISYFDDNCELEGFFVKQRASSPLVLLCHAWRGRDDFIEDKARHFANLGYNAFALDMYGKGVLGKNPEENAALKMPFMQDRQLVKRRVLKGYEKAKELLGDVPVVVLGYGFGGLVALDLARLQVPLKGAISVYGHFEEPPNGGKIETRVLIQQGYLDPVEPMDKLMSFLKTVTHFETLIIGDAYHAFTTPTANNKAAGILYNPDAAKASLDSIESFLKRAFQEG